MNDTELYVPRRDKIDRRIARRRGQRDWRKEYGLA